MDLKWGLPLGYTYNYNNRLLEPIEEVSKVEKTIEAFSSPLKIRRELGMQWLQLKPLINKDVQWQIQSSTIAPLIAVPAAIFLTDMTTCSSRIVRKRDVSVTL